MEIIPQFLQTSYPLRVEYLIRFLSPIISRRRRLGDTTIDCQEKFLTKSFKRFSVLILANRRLKRSTSFVCIFPLVENELQCNPVPKTSISLLQSPLYIAAILSQVVTKDARDLEDPRTASGSRCQSRSFVCLWSRVPDRHFVPAPPPQKTVWGLTASYLVCLVKASLLVFETLMHSC